MIALTPAAIAYAAFCLAIAIGLSPLLYQTARAQYLQRTLTPGLLDERVMRQLRSGRLRASQLRHNCRFPLSVLRDCTKRLIQKRWIEAERISDALMGGAYRKPRRSYTRESPTRLYYHLTSAGYRELDRIDAALHQIIFAPPDAPSAG